MKYDDNPNYFTTERPYKTKFICWTCRKVFKRRLLSDFKRDIEHTPTTDEVCPNCGKAGRFVGPQFRAPKLGDAHAWRTMETLCSIGLLFLGGGFSGGRFNIPKSEKQLEEYLKQVKASYEDSIRAHLSAGHFQQSRDDIKHLTDRLNKINYYLDTKNVS
jgi:hypothetical protein